MTGSYHDAAVHFIVEGREINFFGPAQADIEHIRPSTTQAVDQRLGDFRARQSDVVSYHHPLGTHHLYIGTANFFCQFRVEFIRHSAPNIVSLETTQVRHVLVSYRRVLFVILLLITNPQSHSPYSPDFRKL